MSIYPVSYETALITSIRAYERNARKHSDHQIRLIAKSIEEFGVVNPLLVDEGSVLIAGHGRLAASKSLGLSEVPIIRISGLTEAQKRALRIADNRLAERSTWSEELLSEELKELVDTEIDMELTGFDDIEIDALIIDDDVSGKADEAEAPLEPPPERSVSRTGDIWQCGDHWIICGDARERTTYDQLLEGQCARLVLTDPPYNVRIRGNVSGGDRHAEFAMASGEMSLADFLDFLRKVLGHAADVSVDGSLHYIFIDWRSVADLVAAGRDIYSELKNIIAWIKPNGGMGSLYRSQHEFVALFKKGSARHVNNVQLGRMGRYRSNVWQYPGASGFTKTRKTDLQDHPTVKPVALVADAIRDASNVGDLVLDPFGGSGTTMLAAEKVGRKAALIEIEPRYVDVTLRRFQELTSVEPVLVSTGETLSVVKADRAAWESAHAG